jgi:hypothetical protein
MTTSGMVPKLARMFDLVPPPAGIAGGHARASA